MLAEYIDKIQIRSDFLAVAQVDERFQPYDPENINAVAIERSGLIDRLAKRDISFYPIPQAGTLREASFAYDKLIKKLFIKYNYHLAVLGVGRDGHTAGLLRGYRSEWDRDQMVAGFESRGEFRERITITPKTFRNLDYGLVIVAENEKMKIVERILSKGAEDINNLPGIVIDKIKEVDLVRSE